MCELITHKIDTVNEKPVNQQPYRQSPLMRNKSSEIIQGLLESSFIKLSFSPSASPVVIVPKRTGDLRFWFRLSQIERHNKTKCIPNSRYSVIFRCVVRIKYLHCIRYESRILSDICGDRRTPKIPTTITEIRSFVGI